MANGGNYPFISVTHQMPWSTAGGAAASTVGWYTNASTATPVSSASITPGTTTANWTAPATAPTTYTAGPGTPVFTSLLGNSTASKWYFTQGSNESWAGYRYIQVDLARKGTAGAWRNHTDVYYFFASSASDGSVRHTEIQIPVFRDSAFHTLSFRLTNSSEVYTWGIISAGTATAGSSGTRWEIQNVYKRAMNEVEVALEQSTNGVVLVPANFTMTGEQHRVDLTSDQTLIDLHSPSQIMATGADKKPQSAYIDLTGTSDAMSDLAQYFLRLPSNTDVTFPPNSRCRFNGLGGVQLNANGLQSFRIFGNRTGWFYESTQAASTLRDVAMLEIASGADVQNIGYQLAASSILIDNLIFTGKPVTVTYAGGDSSSLTTLSGSMTTTATLTKIGATSGEVRTPYDVSARYLKGADSAFTTDWQYRFDFVLSVDTTVASDVVIAIKDNNGATYAQSTINATAAASTYVLLADTRGIDPGYLIAGTVRKVTGAASTVNIHSITRWGYTEFVSATEVQHGIAVRGVFESTAESSRVTSSITVQNCHTEGFAGDGVIFGQFNTALFNGRIVNSTSRANARQQIAVVGGEHIDVLNNVMREYKRTALDVEPLAADHVENVKVDGNRFYQGLTANYNAISAASTKVENIIITNNVMFTGVPTSGAGGAAFMNVNANQGVIADNAMFDYSTHSTNYIAVRVVSSAMSIGGRDIQVIGNRVLGGIANSGTRNMFALNRVHSSDQGAIFVDTGTDSVWYFNTQAATSAFASATHYGQVNITSATRPTIIGMVTKSMSDAPDTYKGTAYITTPWFVGGLNLRTEPVTALRGMAGSSVKMNNFLMTVTPSANSTSAVVTFTSKPIKSVVTGATAFSTDEASVGAGTPADWTAAGTTQFYYRIAYHNYYGPASAGTTFTGTIPSTTSVIKIRLSGIIGTSRYQNAFRIYRGEANATTTAYVDIIPTGDAKEFAALRTDVLNFYDLGTHIFVSMTAGKNWGYSTVYQWTTGTSGALTSCPGTDYTGAMLSTAYSVFPGTPNWNAGTVYVASSKTSMGFTLAWTGTTADGTNTIPLMFASS